MSQQTYDRCEFTGKKDPALGCSPNKCSTECPAPDFFKNSLKKVLESRRYPKV